MEKAKHVIKLGVVEGRHEMPVSCYVYNKIIDVTDIDELYERAHNNIIYIGGWHTLNARIWVGATATCDGYAPHECILHLYVSGLTVALIAVINACKTLGLEVVLYHYSKDTDSYYSQQVL